MRSDAASSPSDRLAASRRATSRPQIATRAPPRKSSRAVASPMPDDPPVTTATRSSSPKESMPTTAEIKGALSPRQHGERADQVICVGKRTWLDRLLGRRHRLGLRYLGFLQGFELRLCFLLEHTPHTREPGVMLVEKLVRPGFRRHILEDHSILLEHRPVQPLELRPVHELPDIAHPPFALAGAPEEDKAIVLIDGRDKTGDAEVAAGTSTRSVGDGKTKPDCTRFAELRPIEIHVPLRRLLEDQTHGSLAELHISGLVAGRHRMRDRMQIGPVHRIHHV